MLATRRLVLADQTPLAYRVVDDGATQRTLLLCGGLGGTWLVFSPLVKALRRTCRVVLWDYPGLATPDPLRAEQPVDPASLARHALAILDDLGCPRAVPVGWSFGAQVASEAVTQAPQRAPGLVTLCGAGASPLSGHDSVAEVVRRALPAAAGWLKERGAHLDRLRSLIVRTPHPARWAKRLGLVDPVVDELILDAVIRDYLTLDQAILARYLGAAARHDATPGLARAGTPMLVLCGERDPFVPPSRLRGVVDALPGAELSEIRGATHFLPLEWAELVALQIEDFLARRCAT